MKVSAKATSRYLSKGDIAAPFIAIMDFVRTETLQNPTENKDVLHFTDQAKKPLVLNVTNKRTIIAAYGDESDDWNGQPIEIFVDHSITNSRGEIVGGVRVRIPASAPVRKPTPAAASPAPAARPAAAARPGTAPATNAAQKPAAAQKPSPAPSPLQNHKLALDGMKNARTLAKLNEWAKWRKGIAGTTPAQDDDAEDCYHANLERLTQAPGAGPAAFRRPVTA